MTQETDNNTPKVSAFSKITAFSAVILLLAVALVIAVLFLYINIIRSPEMMANIEDRANLLTRNFMGSPLLVLDVLYISVSLLFIAMIFFVVFRLRKSKTGDSRSIYVDPASSEIIEEKDLLIHREKTVTDTSRKSILLDGENRFRGVGGFGNRSYGGGYFVDTENSDKTDSDGDHS